MNEQSSMGSEQGSSHTTDRGQRRSRSRSPLDDNDKSRDSSPNSSSKQNRNNHSQSNRGGRTTTRKVYVANIPYDCRWTTLKDLFKEKVGDVSYVQLFEDENGKFRGCGMVEFKETSSVEKAVDILNRYEFGGRQLIVKEDFNEPRDKYGKLVPRSRRANVTPYGFVNPQCSAYGLSPQLLNSLGITGPLTSRLFVANIDYKVPTSKLEEVFGLAGKVVKIELKKDEEGNSKGYGTIVMGHPVEAVQAISMLNGQKFFNRTMSVKMDKNHEDDREEKRLPEGLQTIGKGIGANDLVLNLSNANTSGMTSYGMTPIPGFPRVATNSLGLMQSNPTTAGGVTGIGMGLGLGSAEGGNFGSWTGLTSVSQPLGLQNTVASPGITNAHMIAGGLDRVANTGAGLNTFGGGLNTSLVGGIGLAAGALGNAGAGSGSVGGYHAYDRLKDRDDDPYYRVRKKCKF